MATNWINRSYQVNSRLICTVTKQIMAGSLLAAAVGCSSHIDKVTPKNMATMDEVYDEKNGHKRSASVVRRAAEIQARPVSYNEQVSDLPPAMLHVRQLYPKLPNPEVFMYVKPHPTGQSGAVIPGYYTRFSMYERDYYALPSESLGSIEPRMQQMEKASQESLEKKKRHASPGKK